MKATLGYSPAMAGRDCACIKHVPDMGIPTQAGKMPIVRLLR